MEILGRVESCSVVTMQLQPEFTPLEYSYYFP